MYNVKRLPTISVVAIVGVIVNALTREGEMVLRERGDAA